MIGKMAKEFCVGCGACAQICPRNCIVMKRDKEGFLYPEVMEENCIHCELCTKICPTFQQVKYKDSCLKAYAAYAKNDEIRLKSSSGGIFTILAEHILEQNGIVFGAAYDEKMLVHHIGIENKDQLYLLRGSKYMQSRIENTYVEAKRALDSGKKVLYTGTGCQIAGLKSFLKKEYENLLTVDVLCHGVPSPKVWERYIESQQKKYRADVRQVDFRNKKNGWKSYNIQLQFDNSQIYENKSANDTFMTLFLRDICLRPSCHTCRYKKLDRPSDLTIGDAWGIHKHMPDMDDDKGTSIIIVHSKLGQKIFEEICDHMVYREGEIDKLLPVHADSRKSVTMHMNRKKFFKKMEKGVAFEELYACVYPTYFDRIKNKLKRTLQRS